MKKRNLYKLKCSLYNDKDYECLENWKVDDDYKLFARKGQIAERFDLTDNLRDEYCINDSMWKTIYVFTNGKYLLCQDDYSEHFEKVVEG